MMSARECVEVGQGRTHPIPASAGCNAHRSSTTWGRSSAP